MAPPAECDVVGPSIDEIRESADDLPGARVPQQDGFRGAVKEQYVLADAAGWPIRDGQAVTRAERPACRIHELRVRGRRLGIVVRPRIADQPKLPGNSRGCDWVIAPASADLGRPQRAIGYDVLLLRRASAILPRVSAGRAAGSGGGSPASDHSPETVAACQGRHADDAPGLLR